MTLLTRCREQAARIPLKDVRDPLVAAVKRGELLPDTFDFVEDSAIWARLVAEAVKVYKS